MIGIRKFERTDTDYALAIAIHNAVWPDYKDTADEWKSNDEKRAEKLKWGRFLVEKDGEPVALGNYSQSLWMYHPRKFWVHVNVLPAHRRQGIGTRLYEHIRAQLAPYDPLTLYTYTREDFTGGVRFAEKMGFEEAMREWESRLDPSTVDLAAYAELERKMAAKEIEIKTVRELESDPDRDRKLYELDWQLSQDVPSPEPPTKVPFEEWQKVWGHPNLLPDGWFVALHNDAYVGVSNLWTSQADETILYTGLTGVLRTYRRRGIATALKLQAIRYAQSQGIAEVRTWNESNNEGMLSINNALGFVRQPAHVEYVKKLKEESPEESMAATGIEATV